MDILKLIDRVIGVEGGYVNNSADRGGPTRWGISEQVARAYGFVGAMSDLPRPIAVEIYRKRFWIEPAFDRVWNTMPNLAAKLFDTGVNMGTGTAAKFLQRALNVLNRGGTDFPDISVDGRIGTMTIAALNGFAAKRGGAIAEAVLLKACNALQAVRYIEIAEANASQETFEFGWFANRIGEAGALV